jgi:ribosomal protein L11 methyltransferase
MAKIKTPMKNYIEIRVYMPDDAARHYASENFITIGYEGVEEEGNFLIAYCNEEIYDEDLLKTMLDFPETTFTKQIIPEQNWNALWESNFEPVVVDDFAAVRADFHAPIKNTEHEIIITPKMSFGTGHHATTFMMMQQMREIDFANKSVLDFGTGTGILSILVEKLGAKNITAIDNDDWSIENAKENFEKNNCQKIALVKDDSIKIKDRFNIILANINKNIILENFAGLAGGLLPNSCLLLSGLLAEDEEDILLKSESSALKHIHTVQRNQWLCVLLRN